MDLNSLVNYVTAVAAAATVIAVQILKSPLVPVKFQNHPVPVTIAVSAVATWAALASQHFVFVWTDWTKVVGEFVGVLLIATLTYNHVVANWSGAKSLETPKAP